MADAVTGADVSDTESGDPVTPDAPIGPTGDAAVDDGPPDGPSDPTDESGPGPDDAAADPSDGVETDPITDDAASGDAALDPGSDGPTATCPHLGDALMGGPAEPSMPRFVEVTHLNPGGAVDGIDPVFGGVALVDTDSDGWLDIVYTSDDAHLTLLRNCGDGTFYDATIEAHLAGVRRARAVNYADIDGDGHPDLYVAATDRARLLMNDGTGVFGDEALDRGLGQIAGRAFGTFGDFDGDGWVDLYETSYETRRNRLRRNTGDGHFVELTTTPGNDPEMGLSLGAVWTDVDTDGRPDLFVLNDFGMLYGPNTLHHNLGPDPEDESNWLFEDVGSATGFGQTMFGMGVALGDVDNDGDLDAYATNVGNNALLMVETGEGCGGELGVCASDEAVTRGVASGFVSLPDSPADWPTWNPDSSDAIEAGLVPFCETFCDISEDHWTLVSWSPVFFDADQDGWLDLYVANGHIIFDYMPMAVEEENHLYLNEGDGTFQRAPAEIVPTTAGSARGAAAGDLDRDGDLDLVWLDNGRVLEGGLHILENRMAVGNWLQVALVGSASNRDAIGARVRVEVGESSQLREIDGGAGYASAGERAAHFGLGDAATIDRLEIRWPSGALTELLGVAPNQRLTLTEPTGE